MLVTQSQELKAKLQTKGKHRPHKMVCNKMPDGSDAALTDLPKRLATGAASEKAEFLHTGEEGRADMGGAVLQ